MPCYNAPMQTNAKPVAITGVPLDLGAEDLGVTLGPQAFRQNKILEKLSRSGLTLSDIGDITCRSRSSLQPGDPITPYLDEIVRVNEELASKTAALIDHSRLVVLGGDHSINLGAFSGAAAVFSDQLALIYIDAHGDLNVPETSISHNIHGMHLAALLGFGPESLVNLHAPGAKLHQTRLLHIAGSDFDRAELELIEKTHLTLFTMLDLMSHGLAPLLKQIDELSRRFNNVWVSVDLDAIDSVYAPGVGIPNHGGLTYREIAAITEYIGKYCNVVGVDLVEYNPTKDLDSKTAELGIELIARLLGTNYSWYTNYMDRNTDRSTY